MSENSRYGAVVVARQVDGHRALPSNESRMHMIKALTVAVGLLAAFIALGGVKDAEAHAFPESANPPIDGVLTEAPQRVEVVFTEEVVSDGTTLEVFTLDGERVDQGDSEADLNDPERRRVGVGLEPDIAAGRYIVQWTSLSAIDDDSVSGSFGFVFDPAATPTGSPLSDPAMGSPASTPVAIEPAPVQDDDDNGIPTTLLIGVATVVIVAAFGLVVWRGRTATTPESERNEK